MGFSSSISTPISYARSGGIPDLPFLDFDGDNKFDSNENFYGDINSKENNNLKELYDMIPGLNTKDNNVVVDGIGNSDAGNEKNKGTTVTTPSILTSILDKLPYSNVLSDSLKSSPSSPSSSSSQMGQVIPGQYIMVLNEDALNLRDILSEVAKQVNIEGTEILHIYEDVLNGFAISVPNERVIEAFEQSPFVDYIEKDKTVKSFAQTLPSGSIGLMAT